MGIALSIYIGGAALTAIHILRINRPRGAGGWIGFAVFVVGWPILFGWLAVDTAYGAIRDSDARPKAGDAKQGSTRE